MFETTNQPVNDHLAIKHSDFPVPYVAFWQQGLVTGNSPENQNYPLVSSNVAGWKIS